MFTHQTFTVMRSGKNVEFKIGDSSVILTPKVAELIANKIVAQAQKIERENSENYSPF